MKKLLLLISHLVTLALGFAAGIYVLPILTAPTGPSSAEVESVASAARFTGEFRRDLKGSDLLHWGEGTVSVSDKAVSLMGSIAPGPDYKLYLAPEFVENEEQFLRVKEQSLRLGDVKTFENFIVAMPENVSLSDYDTVVVWCESFSEFITAARYR